MMCFITAHWKEKNVDLVLNVSHSAVQLMAFNFKNIKHEMIGFFIARIRVHSNRKLSFDILFCLLFSSIFTQVHKQSHPHVCFSSQSLSASLHVISSSHHQSLSIILFLLLYFTSFTYASTATLNFLCMKDSLRREEIAVLIINKKA